MARRVRGAASRVLALVLCLSLALNLARPPRRAWALFGVDDAVIAAGVAAYAPAVVAGIASALGVAWWTLMQGQRNALYSSAIGDNGTTLFGLPVADWGAAFDEGGFLHLSNVSSVPYDGVASWYQDAVTSGVISGSVPSRITVTGSLSIPSSITFPSGNSYSLSAAQSSWIQSAISGGMSTVIVFESGSSISLYGCAYSQSLVYNASGTTDGYSNYWYSVLREPVSNGSLMGASAGSGFSYKSFNAWEDFASGFKYQYSNVNYRSAVVLGPSYGAVLSFTPDPVAETVAALGSGTLTPSAAVPDLTAALSDAVIAPIPKTIPQEVPTEYPEVVWTPADDEALADWMERHQADTGGEGDGEDDDDDSRLPSPIPWWWPWDKSAPDVWQDITAQVDNWTNPDFDPKPQPSSPGGEGGEGSTPSNPQPDPENPDRPSSDRTWDDIAYDLSRVFPFCIPWDVARLLDMLDAEPVAPVIRWATPDPRGGLVPIVVDCSPLNEVAAAARKMELVLSALGLVLLTRRLIRG